MALKILLGKANSSWGFYGKGDSQKGYTEFQEDHITHNVLKTLTETQEAKLMGVNELSLHRRVTEIQPSLVTDQYGYNPSIPILLKDLINGGLVDEKRLSPGLVKYQITKLGEKFLAQNMIS